MPGPKGRVILVAVGVAVGLAALFVGTALATDRPEFCPTCHEMRPHYDAWATGPHGDVWCIDCHVEPGIPARFAHKFVALKEVYSHVTGDNTFPRPAPPDVPDSRCIPCHEDLPDTIGRFQHATHAEKGRCAQCHYDAGHAVTDEALKAAGVFSGATPQRLAGRLAVAGGGKANLPGHQRVSCSRCHDMAATPCSACHEPRGDDHPQVGAAETCTGCHSARDGSWKFTHPVSAKDCARCHRAPARHPAGACEGCHKRPGTSWGFSHPGVGEEHSYRSFACTKCHPDGYDRVYCTCHKGRPPRD